MILLRDQVPENLVDHSRVYDEGYDPHLALATGAHQRVDLVGGGFTLHLLQRVLRQLSRKPQAVRQVAPELIAELGEPYGRLWKALATTHGEREGARVLARILSAVLDHGEEAVAKALTAALSAGRHDLLALACRVHHADTRTIPVPQALAGFVVEGGRAADYDVLLTGGEE